MDHFHFRDGRLFCESIDVERLAEQFGTPLYVYSKATLTDHVTRLKQAFADISPEICFAVKACPNIHILKHLASLGCGMDVVSGGELMRAQAAGVSSERIVFAGVGKTDSEIRAALTGPRSEERKAAVAMMNVESEPELEVLAAAAEAMRSPIRCALRINPGVAAGGHAYIQTATSASKFGIEPQHARELFKRFARNQHITLTGLHVHIGSSITTVRPYTDALAVIMTLIDQLRRDGHDITHLDIGGGFGADYTSGQAPAYDTFAQALVPMLRPLVDRGVKIILEPGRTICANAAILLTRTLFVKYAQKRKFIVCDAGMHTLLRPSLYSAFHFIWPTSVSPMHEPQTRSEVLDLPGLEACDVVGPVCESGDFLARDRKLPMIARGELLSVYSAGAYGMSMASRYNSHPLPAEVLVDGEQARLIRRRETEQDLIAGEVGL